jgi:low affinity Fe/Cu permease
MESKVKIKQLEKEIKSIDVILYTFLGIILVETILVLFSLVELNILSLGVIVTTIILFIKNAKNRDVKDTLLRVLEAVDDIDAFEKKYEKK